MYTYLWLGVLEDVEASHNNARSSEQVRLFDVDVPVNPGPILLTMSDWSLWELSDTVQPCLTIVETDFDSLHLMTTSIISIASNAIRVALLDIRHPDALTVSRISDDRIQILFVASRVRVAEEGFRKLTVLLSNESRLGRIC